MFIDQETGQRFVISIVNGQEEEEEGEFDEGFVFIEQHWWLTHCYSLHGKHKAICPSFECKMLAFDLTAYVNSLV